MKQLEKLQNQETVQLEQVVQRKSQLSLGISNKEEEALRWLNFDDELKERDRLMEKAQDFMNAQKDYPNEKIFTYGQIGKFANQYFLNFDRLSNVDKKIYDIDTKQLAKNVVEVMERVNLYNRHSFDTSIYILFRRTDEMIFFKTKRPFTIFVRLGDSNMFAEVYSFGDVESIVNMPVAVITNNQPLLIILVSVIITSLVLGLINLIPGMQNLQLIASPGFWAINVITAIIAICLSFAVSDTLYKTLRSNIEYVANKYGISW